MESTDVTNAARQTPATWSLIVANVIVFGITYLYAGTFEERQWFYALEDLGAQFNPFTLGGQWYRMFTHMFLHGHFFHLLVNMYAMFTVGRALEARVGTGRFAFIYLLSGMGGGLASLHFNLFSMGVGASGAIFGVFGASLVWSIADRRNDGASLIGEILNFAVFLLINLALANVFNADTPAHIGGLVTGAGIYAAEIILKRRVLTDWFFAIVIVAIFFLLPRDQVHYYRFFETVLHTEESSREELSQKGLDDDRYLMIFRSLSQRWDSAAHLLNELKQVPDQLHADTFKIRRYITLRKLENDFRISMIERESYVFLDSIERVDDSIRYYTELSYVPVRRRSDESAPPLDIPPQHGEMIKVWYDADWNEISYPGPYYRIGRRDSLNRWQGPVRDYYANGNIQMKGSYKDDKRDGVFLFYSDHQTYTSAGRFADNRSIGKWEIYHKNGRLEQEIVYDTRARIKNSWDSTGVQMVKDGYGKVSELYRNGVTAVSGEIRNGLREGLWYGRHANGEIHYMEEYQNGLLIRGNARTPEGKTVNYDESSFYPQPVGGMEKFKSYVRNRVATLVYRNPADVKLSFRVTASGNIADIEVDQSGGAELDKLAKDVLLGGPKWTPARRFGYEPIDGYGFVEISF